MRNHFRTFITGIELAIVLSGLSICIGFGFAAGAYYALRLLVR